MVGITITGAEKGILNDRGEKSHNMQLVPTNLPQNSRKMDRNAADGQLSYGLHETTGAVLMRVKRKR